MLSTCMDHSTENRLADYVLEKRTALGLSQNDMARRSGLSNAWFGKLETGTLTGRPKIETLRKLAKGLGVSLAEVFEAAGERWVGSEDVKKFSETSGGRQEGVKLAPFDVIPITGYRRLPVYGLVSCGNPRFLEETPMSYLDLPDFLVGDASVAVIVEGQSMAGAGLHEGDVLLTRPLDGQLPSANKKVIASIDGDCTCKWYREDRLGHYLESDPAHGERERWPIDASVRLVAVVVGSYRKE